MYHVANAALKAQNCCNFSVRMAHFCIGGIKVNNFVPFLKKFRLFCLIFASKKAVKSRYWLNPWVGNGLLRGKNQKLWSTICCEVTEKLRVSSAPLCQTAKL